MNFLVDTCAVSELVRASANPRVAGWFDTVPRNALFVSVLTLGEIRKGTEKLPVGVRRERIGLWLDVELPRWFDGRVLPIDLPVAEEWGRLMARTPMTLPAIDALIAATALNHQLTVVIRNIGDFAKTGVAMVNPWER